MEVINSQYSNTTSDEDDISKLPDFLIHHILSFVKVKQAAQTCILSKRWRNIWTSLPFLFFDESDLTQRHRYDYEDHEDCLVDNVLSLRDSRCFDIRRFHLIGGYAAFKSISHLRRWMIGVARSNVEDIYVQFNGSSNRDREFWVPDCVFNCKSLTKLELDLSSCKIILPNSISLPRLKYLKLKNTLFNHDELLTKLCSSCPVLEHLDLSGMSTTAPLNITIFSVTLKHLVISGISTTAPINIIISSVTLKHFELQIDYHRSVRNTLKLYAPNLVYLVLSNLDYMLLEDVSSLVTADVGVQLKPGELNDEFRTIHAPDTIKSLNSLHNVKDLTISLQPPEDVRRVLEQLQKQPFQFSNLQRLKLQKISLSTDYIHVVASLVKISPIIESLALELCQDVKTGDIDNYSDYYESVADEGSDLGSDIKQEMESDPHTGLLADAMKQVKSVEISGLQGSDDELEFIRLVMENAIVLKKMVLRGHHRSRIEKFYEKVENFLSASLSMKIYLYL
ncbi:hypothetical protein MKX03_015605 [Papaver bracteatum]|nr:hypothetical protein MKX03_015605 [Papaver bracteatum]